MGDKKRAPTDSEWLSAEYVKATEWNLATLEEMAIIKGTSICRVRRQRDICAKMLDVCHGLVGVDWTRTSRAAQLLVEMSGSSSGYVLNKMIATMREGWTS